MKRKTSWVVNGKQIQFYQNMSKIRGKAPETQYRRGKIKFSTTIFKYFFWLNCHNLYNGNHAIKQKGMKIYIVENSWNCKYEGIEKKD